MQSAAARTSHHHRMTRLEDQITELVAHIHAATFRLLELLHEFDEGKGWAGDGVISCAHWLNWKCGLSLGAAREHLRVAHALPALPRISAAFRAGELSYSKARAMTREATPANEDFLLQIARHGTASHVERLVRNYRRVKRIKALEVEQDHHRRRELNWYTDHDGMFVLRGRLSPEQGALLRAVLEQALEEDFRAQQDVPSGTSPADVDDPVKRHAEPIASRRADALVRVAQAYGKQGEKVCGDSDRFLVHLHTDLDTLRADGCGAEAELAEGGAVSADTARRLACDAGVVHWLEGAAGEPLSVGRKTRSIPPAIRRALQRRDGGCRFPGCAHTRFVDAHHVQHWADGGETSMRNLVLLCRHHHRLLHEGGYRVEARPGGEFRFTDRAGRVLSPGPGRRSRGNVQALFVDHRRQGIRITPRTAQSRWLGEEMDHDLAIICMQQRE